MKFSLGNLVLFILSLSMLQAEDFNYTFKINNTTPYEKEAIILTLDLNQTNPDVVLLFDFSIKKSKDYSFQRLNIKENDSYHNAQIQYIYLLYPLTDGEVNIHFNLTKKVTTDDSIAYSFSGDRDNVKGLVTNDYQIDLSPQNLHVKTLPKGTQFIGDFTLSHTVKRHQAKAYEALPLQVILKGKGYPPVLNTLFPADINFTLFTEKPMAKTIVTTEGSQSTVIYSMAFSHHKSFTLPPLSIKAFNPKTKTPYTLTIPIQKFTIEQVDKSTLIDKTDTPPKHTSHWEWLRDILGYLLVFVAGYLSAMVVKWQKKSTQKEAHPLIEKIHACKESKALLQLLMATDAHHFSVSIEKLENSLYGDGKINLNKVKQEVMDTL